MTFPSFNSLDILPTYSCILAHMASSTSTSSTVGGNGELSGAPHTYTSFAGPGRGYISGVTDVRVPEKAMEVNRTCGVIVLSTSGCIVILCTRAPEMGRVGRKIGDHAPVAKITCVAGNVVAVVVVVVVLPPPAATDVDVYDTPVTAPLS